MTATGAKAAQSIAIDKLRNSHGRSQFDLVEQLSGDKLQKEVWKYWKLALGNISSQLDELKS